MDRKMERGKTETGQVNKHALYHTHGQLTPAKAWNIAEVAATHAEKLLDYAIDEAEHLALSLAIAGYEALLLSPREAINERKQYTGSPAPAATDSLLCDRMDRIAARFKNSRSEFYNGYKDARAVKGEHSGKRPAAGTPSGTK